RIACASLPFTSIRLGRGFSPPLVVEHAHTKQKGGNCLPFLKNRNSSTLHDERRVPVSDCPFSRCKCLRLLKCHRYCLFWAIPDHLECNGPLFLLRQGLNQPADVFHPLVINGDNHISSLQTALCCRAILLDRCDQCSFIVFYTKELRQLVGKRLRADTQSRSPKQCELSRIYKGEVSEVSREHVSSSLIPIEHILRTLQVVPAFPLLENLIIKTLAESSAEAMKGPFGKGRRNQIG